MYNLNIGIIIFIILTHAIIYAEDGLVYIGDLNNDGVNDKIESGPSEMFGAHGQNGPFILTLSVNGTFKKLGLGGTGFWVLERYQNSIRFWDYNREGGSDGYIGYTQFNLVSGTFEKYEKLLIHPGDGGTVLGNLFTDTIFDNEKLEKCYCIKVKGYTPPELDENGKKWNY